MVKYRCCVVIVLGLDTVLSRVVTHLVTGVVESDSLLASFTVARSILSSSTVSSGV